MADRHATALERLAARPADDVRVILDALVDGRRQMVNGLVATNVDPRAAQRLAVIEREAEIAERPPSAMDLMATLRERTGGALATDYPTDENGVPIHLVGS